MESFLLYFFGNVAHKHFATRFLEVLVEGIGILLCHCSFAVDLLAANAVGLDSQYSVNSLCRLETYKRETRDLFVLISTLMSRSMTLPNLLK